MSTIQAAIGANPKAWMAVCRSSLLLHTRASCLTAEGAQMPQPWPTLPQNPVIPTPRLSLSQKSSWEVSHQGYRRIVDGVSGGWTSEMLVSVNSLYRDEPRQGNQPASRNWGCLGTPTVCKGKSAHSLKQFSEGLNYLLWEGKFNKSHHLSHNPMSCYMEE